MQMLSRFTFGPRPGEVDKVVAMGPEKWFEQQLNPASIPDGAAGKRMQDYPTLTLSPQQLLTQFPNRGMIQQVAEGKRPYPVDPLQAAMYEVLVAKYTAELDNRETVKQALAGPSANTSEAGNGATMTDAQRAALAANRKQQDIVIANRVAGELLVTPKNQRMMALMKMPVQDRIAFTTYVNGDSKNILLADFSPLERELFYGMASNANAIGVAAQELQQAKIVRAILSERQLQEVMTDFWFNHFNVFINKDSDQWYTTSFERDDVRPHALGKFRDLLLATATSPAMMIYLDNWTSIGPNSIVNGGNNPTGKRNGRGLNENYAREVMELHTVGVNGGYTQADVTQLARILTGWTVDHPELGGGFAFDPKRHEPGTKQWFGQQVPEAGFDEGKRAIEWLASRPQTARFISYKLAQRFVADEPPPALVDRMAQSFLASDGDIKTVLRTMVHSPEFNSHANFRNKVKTPVEFVASALRSTMTDPANAGALAGTIQRMGEGMYQHLTPDGYNITASTWMNTTALIDRLNFALQLTSSRLPNTKFDAEHVLAMSLLAQPAAHVQPTAFGAAGQQNTAREQVREQAREMTISEVSPAGAGEYLSPGTGQALALIENALIGDDVSAKTNNLIRQQLAQQAQPSQSRSPGNTANAAGVMSEPVVSSQPVNPTEMLNTLTAMVLGSPEFQLR